MRLVVHLHPARTRPILRPLLSSSPHQFPASGKPDATISAASAWPRSSFLAQQTRAARLASRLILSRSAPLPVFPRHSRFQVLSHGHAQHSRRQTRPSAERRYHPPTRQSEALPQYPKSNSAAPDSPHAAAPLPSPAPWCTSSPPAGPTFLATSFALPHVRRLRKNETGCTRFVSSSCALRACIARMVGSADVTRSASRCSNGGRARPLRRAA